MPDGQRNVTIRSVMSKKIASILFQITTNQRKLPDTEYLNVGKMTCKSQVSACGLQGLVLDRPIFIATFCQGAASCSHRVRMYTYLIPEKEKRKEKTSTMNLVFEGEANPGTLLLDQSTNLFYW